MSFKKKKNKLNRFRGTVLRKGVGNGIPGHKFKRIRK
jgi:hypothetical protein